MDMSLVLVLALVLAVVLVPALALVQVPVLVLLMSFMPSLFLCADQFLVQQKTWS